MLCLDDAAFARLCLAATRIPRVGRRAWLVDVAQWLEAGTPAPPKSPSSSAARTRAYRARQRAGKRILKIQIEEAEVAVGLGTLGLLDPLADSPEVLAKGAEKALACLCDLSRRETWVVDRVR